MPTAAITDGYHTHVREDVVPLVPSGTGTLLDLGGGIGATAAHLRHIGRAGRVGVADQVDGAACGPSLDFRHCGDIEDLGFLDQVIDRDGPFETILCLDLL